jgi:LmbE family N-acetylglucosaminyl deacetylase
MLRLLALIFLVVMSILRLDYSRAKALLRRLAIWWCRTLLDLLSRPFPLRTGVTLVFSPHQDDETFGCGGLIARKRNDGLPVHVVFITDGTASHLGHPTLSAKEVGVIRRQEAQAALAILGVESVAIHFLDEPDGTLQRISPERQELLVARIAAQLQQIGPTEILLPCNPDGSTEHEAAFGCVIAALQRTGQQPEIWQYPVWSWWNPQLLMERLVHVRSIRRLPTEDFYPIKGSALACYRSQIEPLAPQTKSALPEELIRVFQSDNEYFFHFRPASINSPLPVEPARRFEIDRALHPESRPALS